jgi:hypothetical protein
MPSISKKITYSEELWEIYSAMYQLRKAAVQPQEDLHHEGSGSLTVSLEKLEPVYKSALQAMNLVETKTKVYVRRENVKLKVRVELPASKLRHECKWRWTKGRQIFLADVDLLVIIKKALVVCGSVKRKDSSSRTNRPSF